MKLGWVLVVILLGLSATVTVIPVQAAPLGVTITTSTTTQAIGYNGERQLFHTNGYWWLFYSDGTNEQFRSCFDTLNCGTDSTQWSGATFVSTNGVGTDWTGYVDYTTQKIYYLRQVGSTTAQKWRSGTLGLGAIIWDFAEQTLTTTNPSGSASGTKNLILSNGNLFFSIPTCTTSGCAGGQTAHAEIWQCAGAGAGCTMTKINDISSSSNTAVSGVLVGLANNAIALVWDFDNAFGIRLTYTSCSSTCASSADWGTSIATATTTISMRRLSCTAISSTVYCAVGRINSANAMGTAVITDGAGSWTETSLDSSASFRGAQIAKFASSSNTFDISYFSTSSAFHKDTSDLGFTFSPAITDFSNEVNVANTIGTTQTIDTIQSDGQIGNVYEQGTASPFNLKFFITKVTLSVTNPTGLTLAYTQGGVSGQSSTGNVYADFGAIVSATGIYTCSYTVQNASFLYQFSSSGLQILVGAAASALVDNALGKNPLVSFSQTGHVILCIPSASKLMIQNVYVNGVVASYSKSVDSVSTFFSGSGSNEVDFVAMAPVGNGGTTSTTTNSATSQATNSLLSFNLIVPLFIVGSGAIVILVLATRRKMNS